MITAAESSHSMSPAKIWTLHLLCFVFPLTALAFLLTGPHVWYVALLFVIPMWLSVYADFKSKREVRQPDPAIPNWPFDGVLYVLVALQAANILLLARMFTLQDFWSVDTLVAYILVGANSGYSGIVVGHELIHRKEKHMQLLGRFMMATVMYEHFYTEHVRGHHSRVGTQDDPATAPFGSDWRPFFRKTVAKQFKSAWRLETKRLGDVEMKLFDRRQLRNRVLHGLIAEWGMAFGIAAYFGWTSFWVFLLQAYQAIQLLEIVNYFEHWGLTRDGAKVRTIDSWDTDSWFTLYTLVGLSRHADHHAHASRPYQQLRHFDESPKLPYGYLASVWMLYVNNKKYKALLTEELQRRKLGPFAGEAGHA